jgi:hypothetical protein
MQQNISRGRRSSLWWKPLREQIKVKKASTGLRDMYVFVEVNERNVSGVLKVRT